MSRWPLILSAILLVACATTKPRHQWTEDALQAETAQLEGRFDEAERAYERLLPDAPSRDKRRWMELNLGLLAVERGDVTTGRARLEEVAGEAIRDEHGANARYRLAQLEGDTDVGSRLDVVRAYPDQVAAEFALADIISIHRASEGYTALAELLRGLCDDVPDTEVADRVWFELAQVRNAELADPNGALDAYRELFARYSKGPLADDALWEMSNIYRAHQMWAPSIRLMRKLANETESSWFIGSYDSDWVDDSVYDIGWVTFLFLSDYDEAARWFKRYLKDYPDGLLADDAAWNLVEAHRLRGDEGAYRAALERFVAEFPESRYVRQATVRLGGES